MKRIVAALLVLCLSAVLLAGCLGGEDTGRAPDTGTHGQESVTEAKRPDGGSKGEAEAPPASGALRPAFSKAGGYLERCTSALETPDGLYIVYDETLCLVSGAALRPLREGVYGVAGAGEGGLYLVAEDTAVPIVTEMPWGGRMWQSSLVWYDLQSGETRALLPGVQAAMAVPGGLLCALPVADSGGGSAYDFRYLLQLYDPETGAAETLYQDEDIDTYYENDGHRAFGVELQTQANVLAVTLNYSYPSEYPYQRILLLDEAGREVVADSEAEPVWLETGMFYAGALTPHQEELIELSRFTLRIGCGKNGGYRHYTLTALGEDEEETQLADFEGGLQYAVVGSLFYWQENTSLYCYDGESKVSLSVEGSYLTRLVGVGEHAYVLQPHAPGDGYLGFVLYELGADPAGPGMLREALRMDDIDTGGLADTWFSGPSALPLGRWLVMDLRDLPGLLVYDTQSGRLLGYGEYGASMA